MLTRSRRFIELPVFAILTVALSLGPIRLYADDEQRESDRIRARLEQIPKELEAIRKEIDRIEDSQGFLSLLSEAEMYELAELKLDERSLLREEQRLDRVLEKAIHAEAEFEALQQELAFYNLYGKGLKELPDDAPAPPIEFFDSTSPFMNGGTVDDGIMFVMLLREPGRAGREMARDFAKQFSEEGRLERARREMRLQQGLHPDFQHDVILTQEAEVDAQFPIAELKNMVLEHPDDFGLFFGADRVGVLGHGDQRLADHARRLLDGLDRDEIFQAFANDERFQFARNVHIGEFRGFGPLAGKVDPDGEAKDNEILQDILRFFEENPDNHVLIERDLGLRSIGADDFDSLDELIPLLDRFSSDNEFEDLAEDHPELSKFIEIRRWGRGIAAGLNSQSPKGNQLPSLDPPVQMTYLPQGDGTDKPADQWFDQLLGQIDAALQRVEQHRDETVARANGNVDSLPPDQLLKLVNDIFAAAQIKGEQDPVESLIYSNAVPELQSALNGLNDNQGPLAGEQLIEGNLLLAIFMVGHERLLRAIGGGFLPGGEEEPDEFSRFRRFVRRNGSNTSDVTRIPETTYEPSGGVTDGVTNILNGNDVGNSGVVETEQAATGNVPFGVGIGDLSSLGIGAGVNTENDQALNHTGTNLLIRTALNSNGTTGNNNPGGGNNQNPGGGNNNPNPGGNPGGNPPPPPPGNTDAAFLNILEVAAFTRRVGDPPDTFRVMGHNLGNVTGDGPASVTSIANPALNNLGFQINGFECPPLAQNMIPAEFLTAFNPPHRLVQIQTNSLQTIDVDVAQQFDGATVDIQGFGALLSPCFINGRFVHLPTP